MAENKRAVNPKKGEVNDKYMSQLRGFGASNPESLLYSSESKLPGNNAILEHVRSLACLVVVYVVPNMYVASCDEIRRYTHMLVS